MPRQPRPNWCIRITDGGRTKVTYVNGLWGAITHLFQHIEFSGVKEITAIQFERCS
jgi:hypothetical protein